MWVLSACKQGEEVGIRCGKFVAAVEIVEKNHTF